MRRGIGVGYVQETKSVKTQMKDLGSRITAERVGDVLEQLEQLEKQLRLLANRYERSIQEDPVVRAKFRQLAESLGLDLLSSHKNIFSGVLGIGNFYYRLAGKVVECCMTERKFFGSYVPLNRVLEQIKKPMGGLLSSKHLLGTGSGTGGTTDQTKKNSSTPEVKISQDDILTALKKLQCFGTSYQLVILGGVAYIRTSPDGVEGKDSTHLLNFLLERQQEQLQEAHMRQRGKDEDEKDYLSQTVVDDDGVKRSTLTSSSYLPITVEHSRVGAAYVLRGRGGGSSMYDRDIPVVDLLRLRSVPFSLLQIADALHWEEHRTLAAVSRLVQDGTLWVDYPNDEYHHFDHCNKTKSVDMAQKKTRLSAVETKAKASSGSPAQHSAVDGGAVYWFLPL